VKHFETPGAVDQISVFPNFGKKIFFKFFQKILDKKCQICYNYKKCAAITCLRRAEKPQ
jgi:hypothetical protein